MGDWGAVASWLAAVMPVVPTERWMAPLPSEPSQAPDHLPTLSACDFRLLT